jgi:hypothetical protein
VTEKIPGSADEANLNALRAGWLERFIARVFGETLVSENENCRGIARRYHGKIYMVGTWFK